MEVLLVNGSPHERGCTFTALSEVAKTLQESGVETEIFHIGNHPVRGCVACGRCALCWTGCFIPAAALLRTNRRRRWSAPDAAAPRHLLTG